MSETKTQSPTKVVTGLVRLSYAHIWEPSAVDESQDKKYSVSIIIPKSDKDTLSRIKKAIDLAKEEGKAKLGGRIPANLKIPLRDGDAERPDDAAYANSFFINATSKTKPGVVDAKLNPIIEQDEVYSGCYGRVSINLYAFNTSGNKGIAAGLNHIQKIKDGEPLSGRGKAEDDFADDYVLEDGLDDLM